MRIDQCPILLLQWGPSDELDELAIIEEILEERGSAIMFREQLDRETSHMAYRESIVRRVLAYDGDELQDWLRGEADASAWLKASLPGTAAGRINSPTLVDFEVALCGLLSIWRNRQTLYVSCHGVDPGDGGGSAGSLSYDSQGTILLPFERFASILQASISDDDGIALILGSCYGLHPDSDILTHLPPGVTEVYGFTGPPRPQDVAALMAAVTLDQARRYTEYHNANVAAHGGGVARGPVAIDHARSRLEELFEAIDDQFVETPDALIRSAQGESVRVMKRVDYDDRTVWQGYTLRLNKLPR